MYWIKIRIVKRKKVRIIANSISELRSHNSFFKTASYNIFKRFKDSGVNIDMIKPFNQIYIYIYISIYRDD